VLIDVDEEDPARLAFNAFEMPAQPPVELADQG
jgi:hypothetical protein